MPVPEYLTDWRSVKRCLAFHCKESSYLPQHDHSVIMNNAGNELESKGWEVNQELSVALEMESGDCFPLKNGKYVQGGTARLSGV